jgi:choline-sulfatase
MRRRDFIGAMAASHLAPAPAADVRPNILLIMADQHSPHVLGCYGDPVVRTPHLDALAARGAIFEHAYCQAPLCVPSRMSFLTGQQPSAIGVWGNSDAIPPDVPTFAHSLGAAGYETVLIGRMHFNGVDQSHGFEKRLVGDPAPPYLHQSFPLPPELLIAATNHARESVTIAGPGRTAYQVFDEDVTRSAVEFLRDRKAARPFCAVVGLVLPHSPYICEQRDWDYYLNRVTVPEPPANTLTNLHPAVKEWRKSHGIEHLTQPEIRRARAGYYSLVSKVDREVGQILEALEQSGQARNTVVIYTSDHGEMAGENGLWWKSNFYEGAVGVPLIITWPGRIKPGLRLSHLTGLVNLAPTLTAISAGPSLPHCKSSDLLGILQNGTAQWNNEVLSELPALQTDVAMRMVRRGRWKLTHYDGFRPQLFDLETDPHEYRDLGESGKHSAIRDELHKRALDGWSAGRIRDVLADRARDRTLIRKWGEKVQPATPPMWHAPKGSNVFIPPPE